MKTSKLTARIVAISLAAGSCACRQSGALAEDSSEITPAQPIRTALAPTEAEVPAAAEPTKPKATVTRPAPGQAIEYARPVKTAKVVPPDASSPFAIVPGAAGGSGGQNKPKFVTRAVLGYSDFAAAPDMPALLTTQPVDEKAEGEWREDLAIMDNLLRDAMSENGAAGSTAMGIRIKMLGLMPASASYVEDAGVILSSSVGWPLAAGGDAAAGQGADPNRPRDPDSPWDRKKRQLKGGPRNEFGMEQDGPPPAFDQKKLDDLIDDILYVLPQASNFRHLKASESVFVTVGGIDDAGKPVRLTIKAKKSDIDEAAAKTIDAATFKQRVVRRVG